MQDIPWKEAPVFEGFNKIIPKEGANVIATIGDEEIESPLLVTWSYGKGPLRCVCKRLLVALGGVFPAVGILRKVLGPGRALAGRGRKIRTQQ